MTMSSKSDIICVMQVPTIRQPQQQTKEINVKQLNEDELKLLKKQDPFLYYSIPAVKKAKLTNCKPINHTEVLKEAAMSLGSGMVSRKTRVSTECAPSMLLDDLMMLIEDEEDLNLDHTEVLKYDTDNGSLTASCMVSRMLQRKCAPYQCCMMI